MTLLTKTAAPEDRGLSHWPHRSTEEIADAVVWLVSDKSSYYIGRSLTLDGGLTAQRPFVQASDAEAVVAAEEEWSAGQAGTLSLSNRAPQFRTAAFGGTFHDNLGDFFAPIGLFRRKCPSLRGHILNVRRDPPLISECILNRAAAIAIRMVSEPSNRSPSRCQGSTID